MKIERGRIVTLSVELCDEDGGPLAEAEPEEVRYRHGDGELFPALEAALEGAAEGDELEVRLTPEEAFGPVEPDAIFSVPRESFPPEEELEPGSWITIEVSREEGEDDDDDEEGELEARVVEANGDEVILDANHPLAGRTVLAVTRVLAVELEDD